ncbi:hypothetical protein [Myxosarcina sp. GI1]|uniref:hypothetical protein n=1 Tax=Myxosarcina sp. GI1 TaxID=1541065 RepID=UPI00055E3CB6|nr:hypothetical protein [Myxosarcina sp. GI1]
MAIPKKGTRKIIVDGIPYRWYVRRKPTHTQGDYATCITAGVERVETKGSVLSITFLWNCYNYYSGAEFSITPKDIEHCIRDAIALGWQPEVNGSTFYYKSCEKMSSQ